MSYSRNINELCQYNMEQYHPDKASEFKELKAKLGVSNYSTKLSVKDPDGNFIIEQYEDDSIPIVNFDYDYIVNHIFLKDNNVDEFLATIDLFKNITDYHWNEFSYKSYPGYGELTED